MNTTRLLIASILLAGQTALAADYDGKSTVPTGSSTADLANGSTANAAKDPVKKSALEQVIIVYKTHFDIGYTKSAHDVIHEYRTEMCDRLLDAIERNSHQPKDKQFVWTLSGYPLEQILWDGQEPERRAKIEEGIRNGNIVPHALPASMHVETDEPEDLVRGLGISSALCRKYGRPLSTGAKMSDVPGQSWIFPTIFTHAGIKFYHMGGPLVNMQLGLPPFFWWEGPDGSRLLTLYNNNYGTPPLPPRDWPYKTWVYINMTGDNQGPPSPETITNDLAFFAARGLKAKVGKLDDFADTIMKEDLSKLPVVRSDIPDPWIHGVMSMPEAVKLAQNIRPTIGATDILTAQEMKCWGVFRPDISKTVAEAYEKSMRFSEHTFGMANQHYIKQPFGKDGADWNKYWAEGMSPQAQLMEESWAEKADCITDVRRLVVEPYRESVLTLADNVKVSGPRVTVYNPLPWARDGEVLLNCFHMPEGVSLKPVDGGPAIALAYEPDSIEDKPSRVRRFVAKDLPPLGYRTYQFSNEKSAPAGLAVDEKAGIIESPYFKAQFDAKQGRIVSLVDKRSGRELVDAKAPQGFGQYFYERFGYPDLAKWIKNSMYDEYVAHRLTYSAYDMPQDTAYASALPKDMTFSVTQSPIDVTAVMTGTLPGPGLPQKVSIRLTLPSAMPVADLDVSWQKQPDGWPEAGWICLPFKVDNPQFRLGRTGGAVDPAKDITLDNVNWHNSWINTGVAIFDGKTGAGVGLCPQDSPFVSLGEPGEYKFDKRWLPKPPYVYVNLYNNHWRTNFAGWIGHGERMSSRVRLWAFDKYDAQSALFTPAMEARLPLAAARTTAKAGHLPPAQSGITPSRKGVMVSAFGKNPDGNGTILRVWEQGGVSGPLTVALPDGATFKQATPINLRGEKEGEPLRVEDGKISFPLHAYAPASFILE